MSHWTRRQMLTATGAGVATLALSPLRLLAEEEGKTDYYVLPKLPYDYDALEPSIDAETMKIHHDKHHQAYINNAKKALAGHPDLLAIPPQDLLRDLSKVPEALRKVVANNVGGHSNHSIFWTIMGPKAGGEPTGELAKAIDDAFGSFDKFSKQLTQAGVTQFGSGWGWLVLTKAGKLQVVQRANQDSPYVTGEVPLVGVDVWEHAYYLKYKNERPKYVAEWWKVVNWPAVAERYAAGLKEAKG